MSNSYSRIVNFYILILYATFQPVIHAQSNNNLPPLIDRDEGHSFRQLDNRLIVAAAMEKFLARRIDGRYQEDMYETTYRVFNLMSQKVRGMSLKVEGRETIDVAAGRFDTYKVVITPLDGKPDGSVLNITVEPPYQVVRAESKLPALMGGGTSLIELSN